jgi:hypothetical protein
MDFVVDGPDEYGFDGSNCHPYISSMVIILRKPFVVTEMLNADTKLIKIQCPVVRVYS